MLKKLQKIGWLIFAISVISAANAFIIERLEVEPNKHKPFGIYEKFIKRPLDAFLATEALIILSPFLLILSITGTIIMKGNPFFTQERPGRNEKIFKLNKFRSMNMKKDENGNLLPDIKRITKYGHFLRNSSLDELPELISIIKGDMAIVGPRPLLTKYLPLYSEEQKHRHDVRPGLTGYAQAHGRNCTTWEDRLKMDVDYVRRITFVNDVRIILDTIHAVLKFEGINSMANKQFTMEEFKGDN